MRMKDLFLIGASLFSSVFASPHMRDAMTLPPVPSRGRRRSRRRYRSGARFYTPNGKREVARRLRQIQAGQLRVSQ